MAIYAGQTKILPLPYMGGTSSPNVSPSFSAFFFDILIY